MKNVTSILVGFGCAVVAVIGIAIFYQVAKRFPK